MTRNRVNNLLAQALSAELQRNYITELQKKSEKDLKENKEDINIQWVEIIKRIELFENDCYKSMPTNNFN